MFKKLKHKAYSYQKRGQKDEEMSFYSLIFNTNKGPKDYWTISSRNKKNTF